MKKKEFKAALIVALTSTGVETPAEAILESACGKLGRKLRADTGEVLWADEHVSTAVTFYNEYGKPKAEVESNGTETIEKEKNKATAGKPMKNKASAKKAAPKKAAKKTAAKKTGKKKASGKKK